MDQIRKSHSREICVTNVKDPQKARDYFSKFGPIVNSNQLSRDNQKFLLFISFVDQDVVEKCMAHRPHALDGETLSIKRSLPIDDEFPRDRIETTDRLMIIRDFDRLIKNENAFLDDLKSHFQHYGQIKSCQTLDEQYFRYILLQYQDYDQVDLAILGKPHHYYDHELKIMKYIKSNINRMNEKYKQRKIDSVEENRISELKQKIDSMNEEFERKRKIIEEQKNEQIQCLTQSIKRTQNLIEQLKNECQTLIDEYESMKRENENLNEQYIAAELENFELTLQYKQIRDENSQFQETASNLSRGEEKK